MAHIQRRREKETEYITYADEIPLTHDPTALHPLPPAVSARLFPTRSRLRSQTQSQTAHSPFDSLPLSATTAKANAAATSSASSDSDSDEHDLASRSRRRHRRRPRSEAALPATPVSPPRPRSSRPRRRRPQATKSSDALRVNEAAPRRRTNHNRLARSNAPPQAAKNDDAESVDRNLLHSSTPNLRQASSVSVNPNALRTSQTEPLLKRTTAMTPDQFRLASRSFCGQLVARRAVSADMSSLRRETSQTTLQSGSSGCTTPPSSEPSHSHAPAPAPEEDNDEEDHVEVDDEYDGLCDEIGAVTLELERKRREEEAQQLQNRLDLKRSARRSVNTYIPNHQHTVPVPFSLCSPIERSPPLPGSH